MNDLNIKVEVVYGWVQLRRDLVKQPDGSIEFWNWAEHYDRNGVLTKTTPRELTGRMVYS